MFCENLKRFRKDKGISQEQLSAQLNVVRQTISKWEKGLSLPDAGMLVKISKILNVSVNDLLGENSTVEKNSSELTAILAELQEQQRQRRALNEKIAAAAAIILLILFLCGIYDGWNDMFYAFGQHLYRWLH